MATLRVRASTPSNARKRMVNVRPPLTVTATASALRRASEEKFFGELPLKDIRVVKAASPLLLFYFFEVEFEFRSGPFMEAIT